MEYIDLNRIFPFVARGKSPQYVEFSDICVINQACIRWEGIDFSKIKYQNADKYNDTAILQDDDLLIASTGTGTLGRCCVFHSPDKRVYLADSHVTVVRGGSRVTAELIKYYMQFPKIQAMLYAQCVNGSTNQIELSKEKLLKFQIPRMDINAQVSCVEQFKRLDYIIGLRQQELQKLDELVKARFVEMFGNIISNERHWNSYVFSEIATSRLGKMLDAKQQTGQYAFPYLANFNVQWFRFETESLNTMDFNEADREEFKLMDGDLLVCEGGEIGRCAVWHNQIQPCFFQKALHRVRCNQSIILPDYLAWWFKFNCDNNGFAAIEGAKATIAHLPGAKLKQLNVVTPPIELQEQFVSFVKQVDKSKVVVQEALDKKQLLFDSLMQEYFG